MFPVIDYLDWIEGRPARATHDLGSSDLRPTPGTVSDTGTAADGVVPAALAGLPDPPAGRTLESLLAAEYGVSGSQVLVTAGATHANFLAFAAALGGPGAGNGSAGDSAPGGRRVLVERPAYEPLVATPRGLGATVDRFRRPDGVWKLEPGRVEGALSGGVGLAVVTNRHNPTGVLADRETLSATAAAARGAGARLLVDEVYAPYGPGEREGAFGGPTAAGLDGAVVVGSVTKFHGLGGLRVGWLVADGPFVERAAAVADHTSGVAEPSRALARRALFNAGELAARSRSLLSANHDRLADFVEDRPDLSAVVPAGCPYGLLVHERADGDAVAASARDRDLLVVPGRFFELPGGFRVSLGRDPDASAAALSVLGDVLDDL